MLYLVVGGQGSGKSEVAEELCQRLSSASKAYVATMKPYSGFSVQRIEKHRKQREGKGFTTIEKYCDLGELNLKNYSCILIECMGNLLLNEDNTDKILEDIKKINSEAENVVVVSNNIFSDDKDYNSFTMDYAGKLARLNSSLGAISHCVIESVYGIKIYIKGGEYEDNK